MAMNDPLVSICCLCYNHEEFISDCLDGFLMQKTNFSFEILIHDDASIDNSAQIIRNYQEKYPEIVKPIYQTQNQFSRGISVSRTFQFSRAKGKYIAMCEGDDFWTDPLKLQKQVDFLEKNPEYGLIHTDCDFLYQDKMQFLRSVNTDSTLNNLYDSNPLSDVREAILKGDYKIRTATALFKTDLYFQSVENDPEVFSSKFKMGDIQIWFGISTLSKIKYLDEVTAVYRINKGSVTQNKKIKNQLRFQLSSVELRVYYISKYKFPTEFNSYIKSLYNWRLLRYWTYDSSYSSIYPLFSESVNIRQKLYSRIIKSNVFRHLIVVVNSFITNLRN